MPSNVLIGKLCPKNLEATVFAILAAMNNFGNTVAGIAGAYMVKHFFNVELNPSSGDCSNPAYMGVSGLGWSKIVGFIIIPALSIPFTWLLLPKGRLNEDFA